MEKYHLKITLTRIDSLLQPCYFNKSRMSLRFNTERVCSWFIYESNTWRGAHLTREHMKTQREPPADPINLLDLYQYYIGLDLIYLLLCVCVTLVCLSVCMHTCAVTYTDSNCGPKCVRNSTELFFHLKSQSMCAMAIRLSRRASDASFPATLTQ